MSTLEAPTLEAKLRPAKKANALRREGLIPVVVYGPTIDTASLVVERGALQALFSRITRSSRIDLSISNDEQGKKLDVFLKRVQYNPITDEPIHVDFYHPDIGRPLKLHVPVKIVGEAPGVKSGGMLNVLFNTVRVHGLPRDIPHLITVDISNLEIGESIRVKDIDFGNVEPLLSPERALVTVMAPRGLEVEEAVEAELQLAEETTGEEISAEESEQEESSE